MQKYVSIKAPGLPLYTIYCLGTATALKVYSRLPSTVVVFYMIPLMECDTMLCDACEGKVQSYEELFYIYVLCVFGEG